MKLSVAALFAVLGYASAKAPQLSISVRDGQFEGLEGLDPVVSWENSNEQGDFDISYGVKAAVRPTKDLASLPRSIWGKVRTEVQGWGVSARAELDGKDYQNANLELDAENEDVDLSVHLVANAGKEFSVRSVEATKGFDASGGRVTITPRLKLADDDRDVVVNWSNDRTNVKLTASADNQELTLSQQLDDDNRVAPTVNNKGDISLEWERRLSDDSRLTTTLKPKENLNVEWRDAEWTANINMPIDGTNISGANVSIKRDVSF